MGRVGGPNKLPAGGNVASIMSRKDPSIIAREERGDTAD
jgi:hypothetical protein